VAAMFRKALEAQVSLECLLAPTPAESDDRTSPLTLLLSHATRQEH